MDGHPLRGRVLTVRYVEPDAQHVFRRPTKPSSSPRDDSGGTTGATADAFPPRPSPEQLQREAHARELKEAAERRAKEASARAAAEAKVKNRQETLRRKEEAELMNARAKKDIEAATTKRQAACEDLDLAKQVQEMADQELADMRKACAEAKRIWLEAMDREVAAARKARDALEVLDEALGRKQDAEASIKVAQKQEVSSWIDAEKLNAELDQYVVDEETLRQAELAESIRRMSALRQIEQREKEEAARKEQRDAEEMLRHEQEEAERLMGEQREREEQARHDAEAQQRRYEQAVRTEQVRCRTADLQFWRSSTANQWNEQRALERFKFFSDDFDTIKFHDSQPLTFENVPWPILVQPRAMTFEAIDWSAVEKFFDAVEKSMQDRAEFRALVEKAHRRFHPDKWRARGILSSVWDDDLRGQLEAAGNVVAQAITPLWLKARQA
ncbi:hypothetical protein BC629DRAFT_343408 [Irpex lacteus]|nr:hypothetical protein BC629DRAFT_343408 [Irpex lacteus]